MPDNQLRYQSDLGYLANAEKTARREAAKALERDLSKNLLKKHEARYLDRPAGSKQAVPMLIRMEQA